MKGATVSTSRYNLYEKNSNFSEEMLIKHKHRLPRNNRSDMCIFYMHF